MVFGSAVPIVTPTYSGFKNGDSASSLTPQPSCSPTTMISSPVGTYASSCAGAADTNYAINYVVGHITVTPASLTVTVTGSQANGGSPSFSGSFSTPPSVTVVTSGLACGAVVPSTPINGSLATGTYTLVTSSCQGVNLSGPNAGDYSVTYSSPPGDFTVTGGPPPPPPPPPPAQHGYWLVGSDGGIFTFGSAAFHGSTGSLVLQRPVVGITPTQDRGATGSSRPTAAPSPSVMRASSAPSPVSGCTRPDRVCPTA